MSQEITVIQGQDLEASLKYADALARSQLLPDAYKGKPANILVAVEHGRSLGLPPMTAINGINVINGKPTMSADLMAGVVRRAGHTLRVRENSPESVTAMLIRRDDPDYTFEVTWDRARATQAGLWGGRGGWSKYPSQMLRARAITEVCRQGANDCLNGIVYTPEELGANVTFTDDGMERVVPSPASARMVREETRINGESLVTEDQLNVLRRYYEQLEWDGVKLADLVAHYSDGRTRIVQELTIAEADMFITDAAHHVSTSNAQHDTATDTLIPEIVDAIPLPNDEFDEKEVYQ